MLVTSVLGLEPRRSSPSGAIFSALSASERLALFPFLMSTPLSRTSTHLASSKARRLPGIRPRMLRLRGEPGAATAEYAIATMAAVGFAGLLVVIMRSEEVRGILTDLVRNALTFAG